jgi:hypothetical protein
LLFQRLECKKNKNYGVPYKKLLKRLRTGIFLLFFFSSGRVKQHFHPISRKSNRINFQFLRMLLLWFQSTMNKLCLFKEEKLNHKTIKTIFLFLLDVSVNVSTQFITQFTENINQQTNTFSSKFRRSEIPDMSGLIRIHYDNIHWFK